MTDVMEKESKTQQSDQENRSKLLTKAYGIATARLRSENKETFDRYYSEAAKDLGVEYTPRLTPEQKAKQEIADLLTKYPNLAAELRD